MKVADQERFGKLFFSSQYFMQFAIGLKKSNNMGRHEREGKPV